MSVITIKKNVKCRLSNLFFVFNKQKIDNIQIKRPPFVSCFFCDWKKIIAIVCCLKALSVIFTFFKAIGPTTPV